MACEYPDEPIHSNTAHRELRVKYHDVQSW